MKGNDFVIFSGNSHKRLSQEICDYLAVPVGKCEVGRVGGVRPDVNHVPRDRRELGAERGVVHVRVVGEVRLMHRGAS